MCGALCLVAGTPKTEIKDLPAVGWARAAAWCSLSLGGILKLPVSKSLVGIFPSAARAPGASPGCPRGDKAPTLVTLPDCSAPRPSQHKLVVSSASSWNHESTIKAQSLVRPLRASVSPPTGGAEAPAQHSPSGKAEPEFSSILSLLSPTVTFPTPFINLACKAGRAGHAEKHFYNT